MDTAHGPHRYGLTPDRRHGWVLYVISREPEPGAAPTYATSLFIVSVVSGRNAWAVGRHGDDTSILHWDGTRWSRVPSPNSGSGIKGLNAVSALSPTNVLAVSDASHLSETLILHWDGTRWSRVTSPNPGPDANELIGVSATSATDAWAVARWSQVNVHRDR